MAAKVQEETKVIELAKPIEVNGATVEKLTMREPTVGDQLAASKVKGGEADQELFLFATLCDMAPADLHKLGLKDYRKVQEAFVGFTE